MQYDYVELGASIVMPNHFHGILIIHENRRGGSRSAPVGGIHSQIQGDSRIAPTLIKRKPLGGLIGASKTISTKQINILRNTDGQLVWQRNYYEHIVRDDRDLQNKTDYINANPLLWKQNEENPSNIKL